MLEVEKYQLVLAQMVVYLLKCFCRLVCRLTFQPVTNRRCNGAEEEPQVLVFDRLSQLSAQRLQEKKAMEQSSGECNGVPIDKTTGRELFKPQTGRKPQTAVSHFPCSPFSVTCQRHWSVR